ncbi:MAG: hypothetical protein H7Z41_15500 [Cytophagales bacterium]|nr:hypothetical protein [Armatimonadota bacterium]
MKSNRSLIAFTALLLFGAVLPGCGERAAAPQGLEAQQKGILGGTPPPGEQAKINAMMAEQSRRQAEGQAKDQAAAAARTGR